MLGSLAAAEVDTADHSIIADRRKEQFSKDPGYALFPYPYSLPGIGKGIGLVGGMMNVMDTYTDVYGIIFSGEVRGTSIGVADIHLVPRTLILDIGYGTVNEATIQSYSQRGMNTDKHDYRLIEFGDTEYEGGRMTATFFERRFEVYGAVPGGHEAEKHKGQGRECDRRSPGFSPQPRPQHAVRDQARPDR
jgi:hypothetical protein